MVSSSHHHAVLALVLLCGLVVSPTHAFFWMRKRRPVAPPVSPPVTAPKAPVAPVVAPVAPVVAPVAPPPPVTPPIPVAAPVAAPIPVAVPVTPPVTVPTAPTPLSQLTTSYQQHYLVGLLNYPNSFIPPILDKHTSGTYNITGVVNGPYSYIPSVGFSDIEFFKNADGSRVLGQFLCLSDNGYGSPANSADYALNMVHMRILKPFTFRHGESKFERYTQTTNLNTIVFSDPNRYIKWENGADIQVTYKIPDATWNDYKANRVLTGRDFDVEGLAVINNKCAILGDELMPAILAIDPSTGFVTSNFVRTPDINPTTGAFIPNKFLSTRGDKVHCNITVLQTNPDACNIVPLATVDASNYRRHDQSGGYEGFALLADGTIAAFMEKNTGETTLTSEPGARVYNVNPGNCTNSTPPSFTKFMGFYPFETNADAIADVSAIPGSSKLVVVIERNGYPSGFNIPAPLMPANKMCVVDLTEVGPDLVFRNKKCILNYHSIDDPWDVDGNGILKYAQTQVTNEQLIVIDDYCMIAGTDTNFPGTNNFGLNISQVPDWQFVTDSRFMVVCFLEPVFDIRYPILAPSATTTKLSTSYQQNYLVGLLNYPNSFIPPILDKHTSGTYNITGVVNGPYSYIPSVGFSDIEFFKNADGSRVLGQFLCLSDNGYGSPANSADYALNMVHMRILKPFTFRHGESKFERYTTTTNLNTIVFSDPNRYIKWENGADIQVEYKIPDATWNDYKANRVLTGRDFDVEGLAVINNKCAILGDELMPAILAIDPSTGFVTSNFVRTPDINPTTGAFIPNKFLSTRGDKVHCNITVLQTNPDACNIVPLATVDASAYRRHDQSGGYEGFALLADGTIAAFVEKNTGETTLNTEPGARVYNVNPGNCTNSTPPSFTKFMGFYPFETNADAIADVSAIPGSSKLVVVIERNGYPSGFNIPAPLMPANKMCVVDLTDVGPDLVFRNKKCILNYHSIDDPWDVDGNGILKYAQTQVTNEQLIVIDDYCMIAGTDTNFPGTNNFGLDINQVPDWQFVTDSRFMVVCFLEPVFDIRYPILTV